MPHPQRSPYVVNRAQARLSALNVLYYAPSVAVLGGALLAARVLDPAEGQPLTLLEAVLSTLRDGVWLFAAVAALVFTLHSLFLAHRLLGPLVRFRRAFREIHAGHLAQRILLRPKDYHAEEAQAFNVMMDALSTRLHQVKRRYDQAQTELKAAEDALATGQGNALEHLRALRAELVRCDEEWAWFDLAPCTIKLTDPATPPQVRLPRPPPRPALPSRPRPR
jgi:methyl-accepting chemotaxis protein